MDDLRKDICECGNILDYKTTIVMTLEQRICPSCGRKHYVEDGPIGFERLKESMRSK